MSGAPLGRCHLGQLDFGALLLGFLEPAFDIADGIEVLAELATVAGAEIGLQPVDAASH